MIQQFSQGKEYMHTKNSRDATYHNYMMIFTDVIKK